MLGSSQQLDLRRGVLTRVSRYRDAAGRTTRVTARSFVHLAQEHLAVLETTVEAEDWSGLVAVRSGIDGRVANRNVAEYRLLAAQHLEPAATRQVDSQTVLLDMVTSQSLVHIAMAARTRLLAGALDAGAGAVAAVERRLLDGDPAYVGHELVLALRPGQPVTVEKVVAVAATSRDPALSSAELSATAMVGRASAADELLRSHEAAWEQL
jgi:trehalose/maltose hydrolase-like predicted phosphorylase